MVCGAGDNALCGDSVSVSLALSEEDRDAVIEQARFTGFGCSLCIASADVLMETVEGLKASDALLVGFDDVCAKLGGIEVDRSRAECVALPLRALAAALEG